MNQAQARAFWLLRNEIYAQLDEVEFLALEERTWDEAREAAARTLLCDLVSVLRCVVGRHAEDQYGCCTLCEWPWPCRSIDTVHLAMHDPSLHGLSKLGQG